MTVSKWSVEAAKKSFNRAVTMNQDNWVPACGGTEVPSVYGGKRYLYVYNPKHNKHAWYDMSADLIIDNPPWAI